MNTSDAIDQRLTDLEIKASFTEDLVEQLNQTIYQQQQQIEAQQKAQDAKQKFEAEQKMLDRQTQIQVAEIRGASFPAQDLNANQQSDYMEALDMLDILEDENIQNDSGYTIEFRDMNYYSSGRRQ